MPHLLLYLPLLLPVPLALAARPLAHRLEPRLATWLLTGSALALAAASTAALGLLVVAGIVRIPLVGLIGDWSSATVRAGDSVSKAEAVLAALLLAGAGYGAARMLWRRVRALVAAGFEAACLPGIGQLVIVEDPRPEAYALPGLPGRVVVSTGMLAALDEDDREAMLAHERAHLAAHHYAFVAVAHLAAAAHPLLRPVAGAVAYTVERWADELAGAACGDRRQVARAVGKAALAAKRAGRRRAPAAAMGLLPRRARRRDPLRSAGPVPRRVAALLAPAARPGLARALPPLAGAGVVVGASLLCTLAAARDLHLLMELAGH
jgi:Zn-dependent protease with chaperone function